MDWKKLIELLKGHRVYIQTHNCPDPDALASAFGLKEFLQYYGVETTVCYDGQIEKLSTKRMLETFNLQMINVNDIAEMSAEDYIVTVDAQKYNANLTDLIGDEVACIDHHPTFIDCEYAYKDVRIVGSCSTLIADYYFSSNTPISKEIATALLFGQRIDTNSMTRGVTDLDIQMFAKLHKIADQDLLIKMSNCSMELRDLQAYGAAIESIRLFNEIGFAYIPFDCPDALIAMVSDFILGLDVVELAIIYASRDGGLKFSVRSEKSQLNAGRIISKALEGIGSGGGRASMAGGYISKSNLESLGQYYENEIASRFIKISKLLIEEQSSN